MRKAVAIGLVATVVYTLLPLAVLAGTRQIWYLDDDVDTGPGWADRIIFGSPDGKK